MVMGSRKVRSAAATAARRKRRAREAERMHTCARTSACTSAWVTDCLGRARSSWSRCQACACGARLCWRPRVVRGRW
eukprot:2445882-Pleurochrysis_carterae.AAC.2